MSVCGGRRKKQDEVTAAEQQLMAKVGALPRYPHACCHTVGGHVDAGARCIEELR